MKPRQITHFYINLIAGTAVLIAVYSGNAWAALTPTVLFVFVLFPRWRSKLYRLIERAVEKVGGGNDRCDPQ